MFLRRLSSLAIVIARGTRLAIFCARGTHLSVVSAREIPASPLYFGVSTDASPSKLVEHYVSLSDRCLVSPSYCDASCAPAWRFLPRTTCKLPRERKGGSHHGRRRLPPRRHMLPLCLLRGCTHHRGVLEDGKVGSSRAAAFSSLLARRVTMASRSTAMRRRPTSTR
jgi:hypothetical protein